MHPQYQKVKSASKHISYGQNLSEKVLSTLQVIAKVVGGTLGPGGRPVLIERYESDLPPIVTKDGVTVFKNLGFEDTIAQTILECARDVAIRTGISAGDGTTTATVLSYALVKSIAEFCKDFPQESPQEIIRRIENIFSIQIEPFIEKISIKVKRDSEKNQKILWGVAHVSANFDSRLADAVMKCFDLVGDAGNVTIAEASGNSSYQVEKIKGYMIGAGYEDSCHHYYPNFVNDIANQRVFLEKPVFLLYFGKITEMGVLLNIINKIVTSSYKNIVLIATGFSDNVLGQLAHNFSQPETINIYPLEIPLSPQINGQLDLLKDMSAITGATLFDPLNLPLEKAEIYDLGPSVEYFEAHRFRSHIVGYAQGVLQNPNIQGTYEDLLFLRIEELKAQLQSPESQFDKVLLQERLAKVSDGIAKLKIVGSTHGEIKEKKDRAEDAICAVRGAIKHGCLPGAAYAYYLLTLKLIQENCTKEKLEEDRLTHSIVSKILVPALQVPFDTLLMNAGCSEADYQHIVNNFYECNMHILEKLSVQNLLEINPHVYDLVSRKIVQAFDAYLLDSTPAVLEALRNAISIASVLGTLGGAVVFGRNSMLESQEASKTIDFLKTIQSY